MVEMFKYIIQSLEKEEQRMWKFLVFFSAMDSIKAFIGVFLSINIINTAVYINQITTSMLLLLIFMGGASIFLKIISLYRIKMESLFLYNSAQKLSIKILELFIKEDLEHHNKKSGAKVLTAVRNDTEKCISIIISCIHIWVNMFSMIVGCMIIIYVLKWVGVVSCIAIILLMVGLVYINRIQMNLYGEKRRMFEVKTASHIFTAFGLFKEVKVAGCASAILRKYQDASEGYAHVHSEYEYQTNCTNIFMQATAMTIGYIMLAVIIGTKADVLSVAGSISKYLMILAMILGSGRNIINGVNNIEFSKKSYETLRECMDRYTELKQEEQDFAKIRQKQLTFQKGLSVKNLNFSYNERMQIFDDASIDIPVGSSVAIIGVSGIGKTTFLDLVLGLLKPQSGSIFYDDYDIVAQSDREGICRTNLGEIVGYIPQVVYLNDETVRKNISFFEDEIDDERVIESLKCAHIWEDVKQMPEGINTLIGENGTIISGGQRQRMALARALYKDFEILIMDEATAALNMEMEKAVIDSIRQVKGNKTLLIVTHHMSLANECDIVYKIENKKFVRVV